MRKNNKNEEKIVYTDVHKGQADYDCIKDWQAVTNVTLNDRKVHYFVVKWINKAQVVEKYFIRLKYPPRKEGVLKAWVLVPIRKRLNKKV